MRPPTSILFVGLNAEPFGPNPAGTVLSNAIQSTPSLRAAVRCTFADYVLGHTPLEQMLWGILDAGAEAVAFSIYSWNAAAVETLIAGLRTAAPELAILGGGPGLSLLSPGSRSQLTLGEGGHGERPLLLWLGATPQEAPSLQVLLNDTSPYAQRCDGYIFDFADKTSICYDASRGCPFQCSFCVDGAPDRPAMRRANAIVWRELEYLAGIGYRVIDIADNNANQNSSTWRLYCDVATRWPGTRFHVEARAEFFTREQCSLALAHTNMQMYVGLQSAVAGELNGVRRSNSMRKIHTVFHDWLEPHDRRCSVGIDLMFGLPCQTLTSFLMTFDVVTRLLPDRINLNHYQAYQYSSNQYDPLIRSGALPVAFLNKLARSSCMPLEDVIHFVRFKRVYQVLQRAHNWAAAANVCLLCCDMSPATFYSELARCCSMSSEDAVVIACARDLVSQHMPLSICRYLLDRLELPTAASDSRLFPAWPSRACGDALRFATASTWRPEISGRMGGPN